MRQRRVKMMTLYLTRSGTSSQWRLSCISCRQTAVKLPRTSQNAGCCIHYKSLGENDITIVHPWRYKAVDECLRRLRGEDPPNMSESTKMLEASRTNVGDMLFKAEVGRDNNSKHSDVLLWVWCDNIHCKLQRWKRKVLQRASRTSPEPVKQFLLFCSKWPWPLTFKPQSAPLVTLVQLYVFIKIAVFKLFHFFVSVCFTKLSR